MHIDCYRIANSLKEIFLISSLRNNSWLYSRSDLRDLDNPPRAGSFPISFMPNKIYNVLFLCTGNSVRSIMAEALLNHMGKGRFKAYSAGSRPVGMVHPMALDVLQKSGMNTDGLRSKSWDEFACEGAPAMDLVFTVCDSAAHEKCPSWAGHPMYAYWSIGDPSLTSGSDDEIFKAFLETLMVLRKRIELFAALPSVKLNNLAISERLKGMGKVAI